QLLGDDVARARHLAGAHLEVAFDVQLGQAVGGPGGRLGIAAADRDRERVLTLGVDFGVRAEGVHGVVDALLPLPGVELQLFDRVRPIHRLPSPSIRGRGRESRHSNRAFSQIRRSCSTFRSTCCATVTSLRRASRKAATSILRSRVNFHPRPTSVPYPSVPMSKACETPAFRYTPTRRCAATCSQSRTTPSSAKSPIRGPAELGPITR